MGFHVSGRFVAGIDRELQFVSRLRSMSISDIVTRLKKVSPPLTADELSARILHVRHMLSTSCTAACKIHWLLSGLWCCSFQYLSHSHNQVLCATDKDLLLEAYNKCNDLEPCTPESWSCVVTEQEQRLHELIVALHETHLQVRKWLLPQM